MNTTKKDKVKRVKELYSYKERMMAWNIIWDLDIITEENLSLFKELLKE